MTTYLPPWLAPADFLKLHANEGQLVTLVFTVALNSELTEGNTPILLQMKSIVKDTTLEPLGVPDIHLRSQECPPKSASVPDGCRIYNFQFK